MKRWIVSMRSWHAGEAAAADGLTSDDAEEDLDHVQPGPACRREVQGALLRRSTRRDQSRSSPRTAEKGGAFSARGCRRELDVSDVCRRPQEVADVEFTTLAAQNCRSSAERAIGAPERRNPTAVIRACGHRPTKTAGERPSRSRRVFTRSTFSRHHRWADLVKRPANMRTAPSPL
jgi:hypothetical protein